jgi:hypothetical protein
MYVAGNIKCCNQFIKLFELWTGGVAQVAECLPSKAQGPEFKLPKKE